MTSPNENLTLDDVFNIYKIPKPDFNEASEWAVVDVGEDAFEVSARFSAQSEIGTPGTRVISGRIETESNYRVRPYLLRGRLGNPGLSEEVYRVEPVVFKSVNEITSLVTSATYEPIFPDGVDEETKVIAERAHRSIMNIRSGFPNFLIHAATSVRHGFAVFEPIWQTKEDDFKCLKDLRFREQSTVESWKFDEKMTELMGAMFATHATRYELPKGDTYETMRMLLVNINAIGNNVEGISPVRVCVGLRKLKELLLNITGVAFQKYGVPIFVAFTVIADAGEALAQIGTGEHKATKQVLVNRLQNMRATVAPVFALEPGVDMKAVSPTGDMPDIKPMLEYLDALMALVFSNEGALLGSQSFGSYAMAAVSDNKFMRGAPAYASPVTRALTELLHHMIRWNHSKPESLEVMPHYGFRFAGTQDASKWVADMKVLVDAQAWTWPDEARRMAAANMGLSVDAFDSWESTMSVEDPSASPVGDEAEDDGAQDGSAVGSIEPAQALNGAQVTSLVGIIEGISTGTMNHAIGVRVIAKAFNMTEAEAEDLIRVETP